jgi:hypothetical protein
VNGLPAALQEHGVYGADVMAALKGSKKATMEGELTYTQSLALS